jgi:hypothetical protein
MAVLTVGAAAVMVVGSGGAASADVVTPPGACYGTGHWEGSGQDESSKDHVPSDVIKVPREDTVDWVGGIGDNKPPAEGPQRPIAGAVQLQVAGKWITIDSWSKPGSKLANSGKHHYNLPSVLQGVKMKLKGFHAEASVKCAGSVYVQVEGSATGNPLFWAGGALAVVMAGVLVYAGKPTFTRLA